MNITLNVPESFLAEFMDCMRRIMMAAERVAGPPIVLDEPRPFAPTDWMESSNAYSRQIEEEESQEALGYGPSYQAEIVEQASRRHSDSLDQSAER